MGVILSERWTGERPVRGGVGRARHLRREQTLAERRLWAVLRTRGLNIRRQASTGPYVVDFVSHTARLVIEVDGHHHNTPEAAARDVARDVWLAARGYRVMRFDEKFVREETLRVAEEIFAVLAATPTPAPPPSRGRGESS